MISKINYNQLRCELIQRTKFGIKILSGVDINPEEAQSPVTCEQLMQRLPFESLANVRFWGTPVIKKGFWFLESEIPVWQKINRVEFSDLEPEPGDLLMGTGGPCYTRNPKQATVKFSLCIKKDSPDKPYRMIDFIRIAKVKDNYSLEMFYSKVVTAHELRYQSDQQVPLLFRLTADSISPEKGKWKP